MNKISECIDKILEAKVEANKYGVEVQFITSWNDRRPLKTVKGTVDKIRRAHHYGLWDHCCTIIFIGANGKEYKTAKKAMSFGSK